MIKHIDNPPTILRIPTLTLLTITLISILINTAITAQCQLSIHVHNRCTNSMDALKIVQKLESRYKELVDKDKDNKQVIVFNKYIHDINDEDGSSNQCSDDDQFIYPKITIKSPLSSTSDTPTRYQNQLSYVQLQYWLNIQCLKTIPKCSSWMRNPIFPINVNSYNSPQYTNFLNFIIKNPIIKICIDPQRPYQQVNITTINHIYQNIINVTHSLLHQLPTFNKFTHNIRNYLMLNTERIAVMLIYQEKDSKQMGLYKKFGDIIQYLRMRDKRLTYHLSDEGRDKVIFVSDYFGSKIVERLMAFLGIQSEDVRDKGCIVAFRFVDKQIEGKTHKVLQGYKYQISPENILDNKFVFWIQQVAQADKVQSIRSKSKKKQQTNKRICRAKGIRYQYQINSIKSVVQNLKFLNMMQIISVDGDSDRYSKQIFIRVKQLENDGLWSKNENQQEQNKILPFDINQILTQQKKQQISKYKLRNGIQIDIVSKALVYVQDAPIKLCLMEGQEYISFDGYEEIFQYFMKNGIVQLRQKSTTQKQQKQQQQQKKEQNNINEEL